MEASVHCDVKQCGVVIGELVPFIGHLCREQHHLAWDTYCAFGLV